MMTECQCALPDPGETEMVCSRHNCTKSYRMVQLCQTDESWFRAGEEGRHPRQQPKGTTAAHKTRKAENPTKKQNGPGTELHKKLKRPLKVLGFLWRVPIDTGCGGCARYARKMNAWGCAGCRERIDKIADHLRKQAKKQDLPFNRPIAKLLIYRAIRRAEKKATRR